VPLGYDARDRKLVVNTEEAKIVRRIFRRYGETGDIDLIKAELDAEGVRTKVRTGKAKSRWGQRPFTKNCLYRMLQNEIYIGRITHKKASYPGEHKAIIEKGLWDQAQQRLALHRVRRQNGGNARESSLLAGLLFDEQGRRFTPSHATKSRRRYRYYVTQSDTPSNSLPDQRPWRIPAAEIEDLVKREVLSLLKSTTRLDQALDLRSATPEERLKTYRASAALVEGLKEASPPRLRGFLLTVIGRIAVRQDSVDLEMHPSGLKVAILCGVTEDAIELITRDTTVGAPTHRVQIKTRLKRCGGEIRLVLLGDNQEERLPKSDPNLTKAAAKAHIWARQLIFGEVASISEIARRNDTSRSRASSILALAFLAPDIVEAILEGRQPPELNLERLTTTGGIPNSWDEQRRLYGFS
jgi:site-specific DNA recombinase